MVRCFERIPPTDDNGTEKKVRFDFGWTYPGRLISYRASYADLAITFETGARRGDPEPLTTAEFLAMLNDALKPGRTFEGYKGGDYQMTEDTPVWVAQYGAWTDTAVVGVRDIGTEIIIDTAYCEF